jgi:hypothetical protein
LGQDAPPCKLLKAIGWRYLGITLGYFERYLRLRGFVSACA